MHTRTDKEVRQYDKGHFTKSVFGMIVAAVMLQI